MTVLSNIRHESRSALVSNFSASSSSNSRNIPTTNDSTLESIDQGTLLALASRSFPNRKCANFPYCQNLASICKGYKPSTCVFLKNNEIQLPDKITLAKERKIRKREKDRLRMKERRNQNSLA